MDNLLDGSSDDQALNNNQIIIDLDNSVLKIFTFKLFKIILKNLSHNRKFWKTADKSRLHLVEQTAYTVQALIRVFLESVLETNPMRIRIKNAFFECIGHPTIDDLNTLETFIPARHKKKINISEFVINSSLLWIKNDWEASYKPQETRLIIFYTSEPPISGRLLQQLVLSVATLPAFYESVWTSLIHDINDAEIVELLKDKDTFSVLDLIEFLSTEIIWQKTEQVIT